MNAKLVLALLALGLTGITASAAPVNLTVGGTVTASSYGDWGSPSTPAQAIDGNRDGNYYHGHTWHSSCNEAPWIEVDLGGTFYLDRVQLFARSDWRTPMGDLIIQVRDASDTVVFQQNYLAGSTIAQGSAWGTADVRGIRGRKVRVFEATAGCMCVAEFEVYGQSEPIPPNLALHKPATASNPAGWGAAIANANDGNLDGDCQHSGNPIYHSTDSGAGIYWQVDLQSSYEVGYILLFRRTEAPTTTGVLVELLDESLAQVYGTNLDMTRDIVVAPMRQYDLTVQLPAGKMGRYVRISTTTADYLALAEVQVFQAIADNVPPSVAALPTFTTTTQLVATVLFSEPVSPLTATNPANYSFTGGATVGDAWMLPGGLTVELAVNNLPPYGAYSLDIAGVKDLAGNVMAPTNFSGTLGYYEINWARLGTASASGSAWGGTPPMAIDGDRNGDFWHGSVFHSEDPTAGPWWSVDLGQMRPIGQVRVWLRTDCCGERNNDMRVTITDDWGSVVASNVFVGNPFSMTPPTNMFLFNYPQGFAGRHVQVDFAGSPNLLMLAEVEVIKPYQGVSIAVTQDPADVTVEQNRPAPFGPVAARVLGVPEQPVSVYCWLSNGVPVTAAAQPTFTLPMATLGNHLDHYAAVFCCGGINATSRVATLHVTSDITPPFVSFFYPMAGDNKIVVRYNELMNPPDLVEYWYHAFWPAASPLYVVDPIVAGEDGMSSVIRVGNVEASLGYFTLHIEGPYDLAGNFLLGTNLTGRFSATTNNLALTGVASMSSVGFWGNGTINILSSPDLAIDGNRDGNFWHGSVCHNAPDDTNRWWEVDLGATKNIGLVRIWWRTEQPDIRVRDTNATVKILDAARHVIWSQTYPGLPGLPATDFVPPSGSVAGQIVRFEPAPVSETDTEFFNLAEVEVFEAWPALGLSITRAPHNKITISWPASVQGFALEYADKLPAVGWFPVEGVVNNSVTLDTDRAHRFYRLNLIQP